MKKGICLLIVLLAVGCSQNVVSKPDTIQVPFCCCGADSAYYELVKESVTVEAATLQEGDTILVGLDKDVILTFVEYYGEERKYGVIEVAGDSLKTTKWPDGEL
jgi:hypothetical protein